MSNARAKTYELLSRLANRGINVDFDVAHTLRRAELTLHRWAELECGDGNDCASWAIERDESGKPFRHVYYHNPRGWQVWCLADESEEMVLATRRVFSVRSDAEAYAATVAKSRNPEIRAKNSSKYAVPDREKGALKRVQATGLHFYHQTDPRGAALYVSNQPLNDQNYTSGVCCAI